MVRNEVNDAVADDAIRGVRREINSSDWTFDEFDVCDASFLCALFCPSKHILFVRSAVDSGLLLLHFLHHSCQPQ